MREILPKTPTVCSSADHVLNGIPIPKTVRVTTFSPEEWEEFVEEWANSLKSSYFKVVRFGGAGDKGVDIAGYISGATFADGWDNYQCKRYDSSLKPSNIWVEIGKIIYYSYRKEYPVPRKHYFVAPKGIGTSLSNLLGDPEKLKAEARKNWDSCCKKKITTTTEITLEGEFLTWFDNFDFSIFSSKSVLELISEHAKTRFHSVRFGGGLPPRPDVAIPAETHLERESRYIEQIFSAYEDHLGISIKTISDFSTNDSLKSDFLRQRERFYHAESLRNFARDTVPEGTFERLQEEVYYGVIDTCDSDHKDGYYRMQATISKAGEVSLGSNPLTSAVYIQDRQGICHQLASEDRLTWVSNDKERKDGSTF